MPGSLVPLSLGNLLTGALGGYTQGQSTAYQRQIGMINAQSEANLKNAQAGYYNGRNQTALGMAQARADAQTGSAQIRADTQKMQANSAAFSKLPTIFPELANQSPAVAASFLRNYDEMHGTSLGRDMFNFDTPGGSQDGPGLSGNPASPGGSGASPSVLPPMPAGGQSSGFGGGLAAFSGAASLPAAPAPAAPAPGGSSAGYGGLGSAAPQPMAPTALPLPSGNVAGRSTPIGGSGGNAPAGNSSLVSPSLINPFSPDPVKAGRAALLNTQATSIGNKNDLQFQNAVGLVPPAQRPAFVSQWNQRNGTNYPVPTPGVYPTTPAGLPALGPPTQGSDPYQPNLLQASTLAKNSAQTNAIGQNYGLKVDQFKNLQSYQAAVLAAKQQEIALQNRGLDASTAHNRVMESIAAQNANTSANSRGGVGGNGAAADALTAKLNARLTALTSPGKSDLPGYAAPALVTLDRQGNPSGPGAHEYHQIQAMLRNRGGSGNSSGAGSVSMDNTPVTIGGRTATRAQWRAEMMRRGGK